ncbi:16S rRNA (uracil(1498)-N(3))-methyltransferase [Phytoactinopolyspora halotolerans]|uniref:Ribosomal RNA small subunit methyltransferase E n=1 Tax=Phytoactinopolyspora halotolerans TaxID=1981512 RepID=A0A6L9S572_9ACTN|nr:16S rRNA (uracil(1498)-N(3))-methyltransferase [Phytoactinopolyspora halotolerans]
MSLPVFLIDGAALRGSDRVTLDGDEGRHAAVVRRIGVGERVQLTDGAGQSARCVVVAADRTGLTCHVEERHDEPEPEPRIVVVQALAKGDRGETAVETLTEVGVDEIVPWAAERCITRWKGDRGEKALRKWRSTAREAAKQSRRPWFPEVSELASTSEVAARLERAALAVILHEDADHSVATLDIPARGEIVLVVGPEGGIAPAELTRFASAGAIAALLGPTVLRTSTAGTVAAGVVLARTPRWAHLGP